jgi:hypothetical protein
MSPPARLGRRAAGLPAHPFGIFNALLIAGDQLADGGKGMR